MTRKQCKKIALKWWLNNKKLARRVNNMKISLDDFYYNVDFYHYSIAYKLFMKQLKIEWQMGETYDKRMSDEIIKLWKIDNPHIKL